MCSILQICDDLYSYWSMYKYVTLTHAAVVLAFMMIGTPFITHSNSAMAFGNHTFANGKSDKHCDSQTATTSWHLLMFSLRNCSSCHLRQPQAAFAQGRHFSAPLMEK